MKRIIAPIHRLIVIVLICSLLITQVAQAASQDYSHLRPQSISGEEASVDVTQAFSAPKPDTVTHQDLDHNNHIDNPLRQLYKERKVIPFLHDRKTTEPLQDVYQYFSKGLETPGVAKTVEWLANNGLIKLVQEGNIIWQVRGHASNYGDKNAEIHIRAHDNDIASTLIHEIGALYGMSHEFNLRLEENFTLWQNGLKLKIEINKELQKALIDVKELPNLQGLGVARDLAECWYKDLPEENEEIRQKDFEQLKEDYYPTEEDLIEAVEEALEDEDPDVREEIIKELKDELNEDIIRDGLLPAAKEGEFDDLDPEALEEEILNRIINIFIAALKQKGVKIDRDKIEQLLKDKSKIKKLVKTFKERVIDKLKKKKGNGGGRAGKDVDKQRDISIPVRRGRGSAAGENLGEQNTSRSRLVNWLREKIDYYKALAKKYSNAKVEWPVLVTPDGRRMPTWPNIVFQNSGEPPTINVTLSTPAGAGVSPPQMPVSSLYEDMLEQAKNGEYDPFYAGGPGSPQYEALSAIIQSIIQKKGRTNVFLTGEPGVGKTAIVEELARMMVERRTGGTWLENVPWRARRDTTPTRLLSLKMGQFITPQNTLDTDRLNALVEDISDGRTILFIDEVHVLTKRGLGGVQFFDLIKSKLTKGGLRLIISTTRTEKARFMPSDKALGQRFKDIEIKPPTELQTEEILEKIFDSIRADFNGDEVGKEEEISSLPLNKVLRLIRALIKLTDRYMLGYGRPRGQVVALREGFSLLRSRHSDNKRGFSEGIKGVATEVNDLIRLRQEKDDPEIIEHRRKKANKVLNSVLALLKVYRERDKAFDFELKEKDIIEANTFPDDALLSDERNQRADLLKKLKQKIHGQDPALEQIASGVIAGKASARKSLAGLFYLAGPTGVGKTYLAQVLAETLYPGDKDAFIRINMTDYTTKADLWRLIGAPPGYVGYDDPPELLEKVRERPYSVVVFDEIDKASKEIFKFFLPLMETGEHGGVDFSNTIICFTSNEGLTMEDYRKGPDAVKQKLAESLENIGGAGEDKQGAAEFLGRLKKHGKIIPFNFISDAKLINIIHQGAVREIKDEFAEDFGIEIELEPGEPIFVSQEEFGTERIPLAITDDDDMIVYDEEGSVLVVEKKGADLLFKPEQNQEEAGGSGESRLKFTAGVLTEPAQVRIIQDKEKVEFYVVADKQEGIVIFGSVGEYVKTIGEAASSLEVVGEDIYFYSLKDEHIKVVNIEKEEVHIFSKAGYKDFNGMAINQKDGNLESMIVATAGEIIELDKNGKQNTKKQLTHTEKVQKQQPKIKTVLTQAGKSGALEGGVIDSAGNKYYLDEAGTKVMKEAKDAPGTAKVFIKLPSPQQKAGFGAKIGQAYLGQIAIDKTDAIYCYDRSRKVVLKYDAQGAYVKTSVPLENEIENVIGMAVNFDNGDICLLNQDMIIYRLNRQFNIVADKPTVAGALPEARVTTLDGGPGEENSEEIRPLLIDGKHIYVYYGGLSVLAEFNEKGKHQRGISTNDTGKIKISALVRHKDKWIAADTKGNCFVLDGSLNVEKEIATGQHEDEYSFLSLNGSVYLVSSKQRRVCVLGSVEISPVERLIKEKSFSTLAGARSVSEQAEDLLRGPLFDYFADGNLQKGDKVLVKRQGGKLTFHKQRANEEEEDPMGLLTERLTQGPEADRVLKAIEEAIPQHMEGEVEFTEQELLRIFDFKPRNFKETDVFKPNTEPQLKGTPTEASFEEELEANDPNNRNHLDFKNRVKESLPDGQIGLKDDLADVIKAFIDLSKKYHLDQTLQELDKQETFNEIRITLMQLEADISGEDDDEAKAALEEEKNELEEMAKSATQQADEKYRIELKCNITKENELLIETTANKALSLEEEERLIELFAYVIDAALLTEAKFSDQTERAFVKARYKLEQLENAVFGYEKLPDGKLKLWVKVTGVAFQDKPAIVGVASRRRTSSAGREQTLIPKPTPELVTTFGEGTLSANLTFMHLDEDNDILYVADVGSDSIKRYNAQTGKELPFDTPIKGISPYGIFVINDILYVADVKSGSIKRYNTQTGEELSFDTPIEGIKPCGISIDTQKGLLYITDDEAFKDEKGKPTSGGVHVYKVYDVVEDGDSADGAEITPAPDNADAPDGPGLEVPIVTPLPDPSPQAGQSLAGLSKNPEIRALFEELGETVRFRPSPEARKRFTSLDTGAFPSAIILALSDKVPNNIAQQTKEWLINTEFSEPDERFFQAVGLSKDYAALSEVVFNALTGEEGLQSRSITRVYLACAALLKFKDSLDKDTLAKIRDMLVQKLMQPGQSAGAIYKDIRFNASFALVMLDFYGELTNPVDMVETRDVLFGAYRDKKNMERAFFVSLIAKKLINDGRMSEKDAREFSDNYLRPAMNIPELARSASLAFDKLYDEQGVMSPAASFFEMGKAKQIPKTYFAAAQQLAFLSEEFRSDLRISQQDMLLKSFDDSDATDLDPDKLLPALALITSGHYKKLSKGTKNQVRSYIIKVAIANPEIDIFERVYAIYALSRMKNFLTREQHMEIINSIISIWTNSFGQGVYTTKQTPEARKLTLESAALYALFALTDTEERMDSGDTNSAIKQGNIPHRGDNSINASLKDSIDKDHVALIWQKSDYQKTEAEKALPYDNSQEIFIQQAAKELKAVDAAHLGTIDIALVKGANFLHFENHNTWQMSHESGKRKRAYMPAQAFNLIKHDPVLLAEALKHLITHLQNPADDGEDEDVYEARIREKAPVKDTVELFDAFAYNLEHDRAFATLLDPKNKPVIRSDSDFREGLALAKKDLKHNVKVIDIATLFNKDGSLKALGLFESLSKLLASIKAAQRTDIKIVFVNVERNINKDMIGKVINYLSAEYKDIVDFMDLQEINQRARKHSNVAEYIVEEYENARITQVYLDKHESNFISTTAASIKVESPPSKDFAISAGAVLSAAFMEYLDSSHFPEDIMSIINGQIVIKPIRVESAYTEQLKRLNALIERFA